jgi:cleavage and polyadenylation specificity factor subunit 3
MSLTTFSKILVHGEKAQMTRLRSKLLSLNNTKSTDVRVYSPQNAEEVRIPFRKDKTAKVVGRLAQINPPRSTNPEDTQILNGVLVQNGFKLNLMAPEDLREYAGLTTTTIMCKQHITLSAAGIELIKWALESTFGAIEEVGISSGIKSEGNGDQAVSNGHDNGTNGDDYDPEHTDEEVISSPSRKFLVMGCVVVTWSGRNKELDLEWEGNTMNDGIADAVMAVLLTVESSPAAVKYSSARNGHHHHNNQTNGEKEAKLKNVHAELSPEERFSRLCMFLEEQFGQGITPIETPKINIGAMKSEKAADGAKQEAVETDSEKDDEEDAEELEAAERARLASLGIPVPGLEIKVDKHVAKLWLETLEVECANNVLRDRVRAVVERAVETVAPLWSVKGLARR